MNRIALAALVVFVVCLSSGPAVAQQVAATDAMVTGVAQSAEDSGMTLRLFRLGAAASAPLLLRPDDKLFLGVGYDLLLRQLVLDDGMEIDGRRVEADQVIKDNRLEDELHLSALTLFYLRRINPDWRVSVRGTIRYGGDYAALVARGLDPSGAIGASVQLAETFRLVFGLAYIEALAPVYAAPYVGWEWEPTDWFTSKGSIPRAVVFTFHYFDLLEWDLFGRVEGGDFWVDENDLDIDYYRYLQVQAGSGVGFRITHDLWFSVQAGGTPYLLFEARRANDDVVIDGEYQTTWFARVLIELRSLPGAKKKTTYEPAHPIENPSPMHQ